MSITTAEWIDTIIRLSSPEIIWNKLFDNLKDLAINSETHLQLHRETIIPDRLLAEGAWNLWQEYEHSAPKTSLVLKGWWEQDAYAHTAVLVLDALSLRQLPALLKGAVEKGGVTPTSIRVTGSEVPSDTNHFARALGVPSRSSLQNNNSPPSFILHQYGIYTDVLQLPFGECSKNIPNEPNLFIWHSWLDDLIHLYKKSPEQIYKTAWHILQSDDFWNFINHLRLGRRLIITGDHGYAESKQFPEAQNKEENTALRDMFGGLRYHKVDQPRNWSFMPPTVLTVNNYYVVIGQKKWAVQSGFPDACHGGLSLLEVAVPFVEFPPLGA